MIQKEALENVVLTGANLKNNSNGYNYANLNGYNTNFNTNHNSNSKNNLIKSPNKEDRKNVLSLDRKNSEKKITQATNLTNNISSDGLLKKTCICHTYYNESVIKNNICTICNRYVENTNINENTIKKRYQQQEGTRPR